MGKRARDGDLFDEPKAETKEKLNPYFEDKDKAREATSAWIKSLRLRRQQDSMYWLNVMSQEFGDWYCLNRMAVFAGEDCFDPQAIILTASVQSMFDKKVPDIWNHIYYLNWYLLQCPKVWEVEASLEIQRDLMALDIRYKFDEEGRIIPEETPSWAIDMHTAAGRAAAGAKEWDKVDRRFGGDDIGSLTKILMFKQYGRLDPDDGFDCYWKAYNILKKRKEQLEPDERE